MQQLAAAILGLLTSLYPAIDEPPLRPPSTVNPAEFSNRPTGLLLTHFLAAGAGITVYRVGFVIKPTAVLLGLFLLRGLREPHRSTQPTLTGAFRTVRQLVAAQGASFPGSGG
jgi:hypothetical protein